MKKKALVVLEDGTVYEGWAFGAFGEKVGEIVFNTSMTGYQEILTDPSYKGQIVTMTYPLIGNYGVNSEDLESDGPKVEGFIVRDYSQIWSNWRGEESLGDFLKRHGIIGIEGVDTRALTRHIRLQGAMKGCISTEDLDPQRLLQKAREWTGLIGQDMVKYVTCEKPYKWSHEGRFRVVAYDFGVKRNILRILSRLGCQITVVPAWTKAEEVMALDPDGIFLSNGPGDPQGVSYAVEEIKKLLDKRPIFGICLGHQLLCLAFGGKTYKLKFGHRGGNHPVKDLRTGRISITSQNHGFCVDPESLPEEVEITHINLYDHTLEGVRHKELPIFSVQFHPEASPGPHDAEYLFQEFIRLMEQRRH
jgi:carbamoyl-phosphate synthase small subunit